ncbi:steroidogenic acute regulatory protein-like isoform X2 [Anopheles stephensi]|uniref:steroidogenic acute regulatory protein-like isoform X2 n=1 Tax=Anopheles stephensi TaxID=30069 RepID=UPI0016588D1D|nr:steroidogenic acute regulatory protein-like isoform X2 [Anopheles stephensi]XP_035918557.1 steroidogenic acute regulatory protein-like isoform X2 [Anopheles stephensi]XP_035918558.1 steroidogenic acute regulatory protein-like isoform X2 [Anopheles stephensi]XP_035918559.1 steroidogenic acute regulatory protein-like isoform X2 [Anopheles stephensi]
MADDDDIRTAVHSLYAIQQQQLQQHTHSPVIHHQSMMHGGSQGYGSGPPMNTLGMTRSQSHTVNLLSEDFIAGYMEQGRMSVVRRFFCLFVTFDVVFISLLWIICVVITGDNVIHALQTQVLHYTVYTSLFDVVIAALIRFIFLILFYGLLSISHWLVIALSTTSSCAFLISKVFLYDWTATPQPVFEVLLIVVSFVLAWGEAWFLDCRVIPQERYARNYFVAITNPGSMDARTPLLGPFLSATVAGRTESIGNFYSPIDSIHNSDDDDDEDRQDDEFKRMGTECVRRAYTVLESDSWKIEKVTSKGDTIQSCHLDKLGKVYKLTAKIHYPARKLLEVLFYKIEDVPKWNPTLVQSKIIRKIDSHTDITYQATMGGGGGVVKCRDFVNLRCWHLCRDGRVIEGVDILPNPLINLSPVTEESEGNDGSVEQSEHDEEEDAEESDGSMGKGDVSGKIPASKSVPQMSQSHVESLDRNGAKGGAKKDKTAFKSLSKSLGAQDFAAEGAGSGANPKAKRKDAAGADSGESIAKGGNVYVSSAISIEYPGAPNDTIFIRGENKLSCWAMRELENQKDHCIFEWLLCLDLKGYIPRYVLDTAYTTLMQDYMNYLRKYVTELRKDGKVPGGFDSTDD